MDAALWVRGLPPASPDAPREVASELPEFLVKALHGIKLLTGLDPDWDKGDIEATDIVFNMSMVPLSRKHPTEMTERNLAVARLYFWLHKLPHLSGTVTPHPFRPLSAYLAKQVNQVWTLAPELLGPDAHWVFRKLPRRGDEPAVMAGNSVAALLACHGVVLDSGVLHPDAAAVLNDELATDRCIGIARDHGRMAALQHAATTSPAAAQRVYAALGSESDLVTLACGAAAPVDQAEPVVKRRFGVPVSAFTYSKLSEAAACRALLAGMAASGFRSTPPQIGWASHMQSIDVVDEDGDVVKAALSGLTVRLLEMAGNGFDVSGYRQTVRDIGTVVGYGEDPVETRRLVADFAGSLGIWLNELAATKWPKRNGVPMTDPEVNQYVAALIEKVDDASFFDGLLDYLAEHHVDPGAGLFHFADGDRARGDAPNTLDSALREAMPAGFNDAYAALYRSRLMSEAIAARAGAGTCDTPAREVPAAGARPARRRPTSV